MSRFRTPGVSGVCDDGDSHMATRERLERVITYVYAQSLMAR
jgi:hypothetical protein